jgi:hypothetical protein
MPAAVPIAMLGSSVIGGALANRQQQQTTPTLDPRLQGLQSQVLQMIQGRLSNPTGVPAGYVGGGIRDINASYGAGQTATENALTSRGLGTSPIAGQADLAGQLARAGAIGTFRSNVPLVARQLQNEDLGLAGNLLGQGRGLASTGQYGGGAGGAAEGLASMLGYLQALGKFPGQQQGAQQGYGGPNMGLGVSPYLTNTPF